MATLQMPVSGYRGMSTWRAHINRGTPSTEPGTDLYVPIGTPVYAPADGTIWGFGLSIAPATGRWVGINFDNGMSFRALHMSRLVRTSGRVSQGELIAYSGASGYGEEDWSWNVAETGGAHTHVTLWPTWDHIYGYRSPGVPYTIDFMNHVGGAPADGGATDFTIPKEWDEMATKDEIKAAVREVIAERTVGPLSIVPLSDGGIHLFSAITGRRAHISSPYHVTIIQRAIDNNSNDNMLVGEIDIVSAYILAVNPPASLNVDTDALAAALGRIQSAEDAAVVKQAVKDALAETTFKTTAA